jgi:hypothetical protein
MSSRNWLNAIWCQFFHRQYHYIGSLLVGETEYQAIICKRCSTKNVPMNQPRRVKGNVQP